MDKFQEICRHLQGMMDHWDTRWILCWKIHKIFLYFY